MGPDYYGNRFSGYSVRLVHDVSAVDVTKSTTENTWTLTMPAGAVMLSVEYLPDPVSYKDAAVDATTHEVTFTDETCEDYTVVTDSDEAFEDGKWYVVNGNVTVESRITVTGTANIILCDGAEMTSAGITVSEGGTLNIYAQTADTGKLIVTGPGNNNAVTGDFTVNGGTVEITGGANRTAVYGDVTVNGGTVTVNGGNASSGGCGIGVYGNVTVNGGTITVNGGSFTGIGTNSGGKAVNGNVTVTGGTLTAIGGNGAFVGRAVTGTITGSAKESANGTAWTAVLGTSSEKRYVKVTAPHTHNFTYSADGATLTATCTAEGCGLTDNKATLSISASDATYDANTHGATPDSAAGEAAGLPAPTIKYTGCGTTTYDSETAPTNAGTYKASITLGKGTAAKIASVDYEIAKANPTYTVPTGLTATYGDTLSSVTLPTGWTWASGSQSVGNAGTKTFKANFAPADTANYNTVSNVNVTVTVGKAAGSTAVISTDTMSYTSESIYIEGVAGHEYIIVRKGTAVTDSDWNNAVLPNADNDNWVLFNNLNAATEYEIYTRTAETDNTFVSAAVKANVYTTLSCIGLDYDSTLVGATITVEPEPETEGLTYKWYQTEVTDDDEGALHYALAEIVGAAGASYTFRAEDNGKYITAKIFAGDSEVGDIMTAEPVALSATVIFDSKGGSKVESATDLAYQAKLTRPADPTRKDYAFDGWFWDEEYETPWDFENEVITWSEYTLYAKWTPNDYAITSVTGLSGANDKQWAKGAKDGVVITVKVSGDDNSFEHFIGVKLDGKDLVKDVDYTVKKGSTIVTLNPETLEKLSVGDHTVTVLFDNG